MINAFSEIYFEVVKDRVLSSKTKELLMVGITVAQHCEYCLWKLVPEAVKLGANREEILEAVSTAILIAGGSAVAYRSIVILEILDELRI